jgi:hypothetical protein
MVITLPSSRFRRQSAWVLLALSVVFLVLLFRDLYTGKMDLSLGFPDLLTHYTLEFLIAGLCILSPYVAVLLFWPGQIEIDSEAKTMSYVFSSLWIFGREYSTADFRSVEVRSSGKKEAKEYHLLIKGSEQSLSFSFPDLKVAVQAGKDIAQASGLRNKGYAGAKR